MHSISHSLPIAPIARTGDLRPSALRRVPRRLHHLLRLLGVELFGREPKQKGPGCVPLVCFWAGAPEEAA